MVMSRYYSPYYSPRVGMAAFMYQQREDQANQPSQYYLPDRRRQTPEDVNYNIPQQENEVFYQQPENPVVTEPTELVEPTGKTDISTTVKAIVPEIVEPEVEELEEPEQKPRKRVLKKKPVYKPVESEEDDDHQMPKGAFFPMFFGWGRKGGDGGAPGGAIAIANAFSMGRGEVSSHATAYGAPRPEPRMYQ